MADQAGTGYSFRPTEVGVYFGLPGVAVSDPYFKGIGLDRTGCKHCGGCMVGCRYNAKNTLPKNYLYFAEKNGAKIFSEAEVIDIRPLITMDQNSHKKGHALINDNPRYEISFLSSTSFLDRKFKKVLARHMILAGVLWGLSSCFSIYVT